MRVLNLFAILLVAGATALVASAASPMQPGLWEIKVATDLGGQPEAPESSRECIAQKDIDDDTKALPRPNGECRLSNVVRSGNRTSYDIACKLDKLSSSGRMELVFSGDSYEGKAQFKVSGMARPDLPMIVAINAKRVGDCSK